ncbi:DUF2726 domain-containing protein [Paracoccus sp. (in: a-proteobacteria)]|uniref:DUF2726 domain-containing protein n=1 Tax=Paracoccus sp. TaxID=267 RepID=UPI003A83C836
MIELIIVSVVIAAVAYRRLQSRKLAARQRHPTIPVQTAQPPPQDPLYRQRMFAEIAEKSNFSCHPVLHEKEADLFRKIEQRVTAGWNLKRQVRILAQVNMGEFVHAVRERDFSDKFHKLGQGAINSKRVDFLLTCYHFHPRVAIEFQGREHQQDEATALRDEVKRIAFQKANIPLVEITPDETEDDYMPRIHRALRFSYPNAFRSASES